MKKHELLTVILDSHDFYKTDSDGELENAWLCCAADRLRQCSLMESILADNGNSTLFTSMFHPHEFKVSLHLANTRRLIFCLMMRKYYKDRNQ